MTKTVTLSVRSHTMYRTCTTYIHKNNLRNHESALKLYLSFKMKNSVNRIWTVGIKIKQLTLTYYTHVTPSIKAVLISIITIMCEISLPIFVQAMSSAFYRQQTNAHLLLNPTVEELWILTDIWQSYERIISFPRYSIAKSKTTKP